MNEPRDGIDIRGSTSAYGGSSDDRQAIEHAFFNADSISSGFNEHAANSEFNAFLIYNDGQEQVLPIRGTIENILDRSRHHLFNNLDMPDNFRLIIFSEDMRSPDYILDVTPENVHMQSGTAFYDADVYDAQQEMVISNVNLYAPDM